jgi:hypothetical protein
MLGIEARFVGIQVRTVEHLSQDGAQAPDVHRLVVVLLGQADFWRSVPPSHYLAGHLTTVLLPFLLVAGEKLRDLLVLVGLLPHRLFKVLQLLIVFRLGSLCP